MQKVKAFNFDLDTEKLRIYYSTVHPEYAYGEIRRFMEKHDFTHRQGSGYVSNQRLSELDVLNIIDKLRENYSWIKECVKCFDVTDVGKQYDLYSYLCNEVASPVNEVKPRQPRSQGRIHHSKVR